MSSPRILFVTPEFDDFVRVGGLAAVSAALPRALHRLCDIRVVIPRYPQVLAHCANMQIVGCCSLLTGLPACSVGRIDTPDGLPVYVVLCPVLYEREGTPYGDMRGPIGPTILSIHNLAYQGLFSRETLGRIGAPRGRLPGLFYLWIKIEAECNATRWVARSAGTARQAATLTSMGNSHLAFRRHTPNYPANKLV
jgi:glycogen synthase